MKIGIFSDTYLPQINGVTVSIVTLKAQLETMGHEVFIFTSTDPNAPKSEQNIYRIPSIAFRTHYRLGFFVSPQLVNLIRKLSLDVIHTQTEFSLGILGRVIARTLSIPLVHTMHTHYEHYLHYLGKLSRFSRAATGAITKYTASFCNSARHVIAPSAKTCDILISYGVRKNISVVPTGIDLAAFRAARGEDEKIADLRAQLNIAEHEKVIVNVGRMSKEKNLDEILRAMVTYLPSNPDVKLLLVGAGAEREALEDFVNDANLGSQVIFAGAQPHNMVPLYYALGDVFISASQSETQGLTYIEALAAGLPVIAKSDSCLLGVLYDDENGYSFINNDSLISALDSILCDDEKLERFSRCAQHTAEKFSNEAFAKALVVIYYTEAISQSEFFRAS